MVTLKDLRQIFQKSQVHLKRYSPSYHREYWQNDFTLSPHQIFKGIATNRWQNASDIDCRHYLLMYNTYSIIPRYCFDCFKIVIEPQNVIDLFRLMLLFDNITLPRDNTRKCTTEVRGDVSGSYKGFIYSQDLQESKEILPLVKDILAENIAADLPVSLKRGCSEFLVKYPDFVRVDPVEGPLMQYREEWQEVENSTLGSNLGAKFEPARIDHYDNLYSPQDMQTYRAMVMLYWVKYAATIGDESYLEITGKPVPKFANLKRPALDS